MKPFEDLLGEVVVHAPWCGRVAAVRYLLRAAEELCVRSWVWQEMLDTDVAVAASLPIEPYTPCGSRLIAVRRVWVGDKPLVPVSRAVVERLEAPHVTTGAPEGYYCEQPSALWLVPRPSERVVVTAKGVLAPTLDATRLPDMLVDEYGEGLVAGALARILLLPSASQSDAVKASTMSGVFTTAVRRAKRGAMIGHLPGEMQIEPHPLV